MRMGLHTLAISELNKVITAEPRLADAYTLRAIARASTRDFKRAYEDAEIAMTLDASGRAGLLARCTVQAMAKNLQGARADCSALVTKGVRTAAIHALLGNVHLALKSYDDAIESYSAAIPLSGLDQSARFKRGLVFLLAHKPTQALEDFRQVIDREPGHSGAITVLSMLTEPQAKEGRMRIAVYRLADPSCADECPEWISAQGPIGYGSAAEFAAVLRRLGGRKLPVFIHSKGGLLSESYAIGRAIRAQKLDVYITRTQDKTCTQPPEACRNMARAKVRLGVPRGKLAVCASACVNILAAGNVRSLGNAAVVGVHRAASIKWFGDGKKVVSMHVPDTVYSKMSGYFEEMGVDTLLMQKLLATPHASIHWLTRYDMRRARLVTGSTSGEQLLTKAEADDWSLTPKQVDDLTAKLEKALRVSLLH